jgi:DNA-binding NtrC family response regulator
MSPIQSSHSSGSLRTKRTALVVDDVDDMLDLLEIALNAAEFSVLRASNADDALELFEARSGEIDLLMTDVRVGTDSGLELAQSLLASKPSLQVLAISGFALDGRLVNGGTKIDFLPKPFSTSELKRKLQSIFPPQPQQLTVTVSGTGNGGYTVSASCAAPRRSSPPEQSQLGSGRR